MSGEKQKKRGKLVLALACAIAAAAAVGITLAYMIKRAERTDRLIPATVTCQVSENVGGTTYTDGEHEADKKSDIRVKNTGTVDAYLRVRLVTYWVNVSGEPVGLPGTMPQIVLNGGWVAGSDNTYYYATPVAPGEQTDILCAPITLQQTTTASGDVARQVVEVFGEAIQAAPTDAAAESWGVTLTDGKITAAP